MQIEIQMDSQCQEPRVIIVTDKITEEINKLIKRLSEEAPPLLVGFRDNTLEILQPAALIRVYAAGGKVYAVSGKGSTSCACGCMRLRSGWIKAALCVYPIRKSST